MKYGDAVGLEESIDYGPAWEDYRRRRRVARVWGGAGWAMALLLGWPGLLRPSGVFYALMVAGTLNFALGARIEAFHCPRCGKLFRGVGSLRSVVNIRRSKCGYCGIGVGENPST